MTTGDRGKGTKAAAAGTPAPKAKKGKPTKGAAKKFMSKTELAEMAKQNELADTTALENTIRVGITATQLHGCYLEDTATMKAILRKIIARKCTVRDAFGEPTKETSTRPARSSLTVDHQKHYMMLKCLEAKVAQLRLQVNHNTNSPG
jgi:hypothetical protein